VFCKCIHSDSKWHTGKEGHKIVLQNVHEVTGKLQRTSLLKVKPRTLDFEVGMLPLDHEVLCISCTS